MMRRLTTVLCAVAATTVFDAAPEAAAVLPAAAPVSTVSNAAAGSVQEQAPTVSLAMLVETNGRSSVLHKALVTEAAFITRPFVEALGPADRLAVFTYADRLETVIDTTAPRSQAGGLALSTLPPPAAAATNFYDALLEAIERSAQLPGQRALLVVSTGTDTASRATFEEVLEKAEKTGIPIYVFGLADLARRYVPGAAGAETANLPGAERRLQLLADSTGGKAYLRSLGVAVAGVTGEMMQRLRTDPDLRYTNRRRAEPASTLAYQPAGPVTGAGVSSSAGNDVGTHSLESVR